MKRVIGIFLAVSIIAVVIDGGLWWTGRVPASNVAYRAASSAPELRIRGSLQMYSGAIPMKLSDLKPAGRTDSGVIYYRIHDWPDGMPGGWLYVPQSDGMSYRYKRPSGPGVV